MSDGSVYVTFGGDTSELEASAASAKASINALSKELSALAREQQKTGASAESDLGQQMLAVAGHLAEAKAGFAETRAAIAEAGKGAKEGGIEFAELKDKLIELAALGGVAFGLDAIKEWALGVTEAAETIQRDAASMGVSLEQVQQLAGTAKLSGSNYDEMVMQFEKLQLALAKTGERASPATAALKALGVSLDEIRGKTVAEQIDVLAEAFSHFGDGPNKTAAAMALLGKSGADLIPYLDRGREGMEEMNAVLERTGYVLSGETIAAFAATQESVNELGVAATALSREIFSSFNDVMRGGVTILTDWVEAARQSAAEGGLLADALRPIAFEMRQFLETLSGATMLFRLFGATADHASIAIGQDVKEMGVEMADVFNALSAFIPQFFRNLLAAGSAAFSGIAKEATDAGAAISAFLHGSFSESGALFGQMKSDAAAAMSQISGSMKASIDWKQLERDQATYRRDSADESVRASQEMIKIAEDTKRELSALWGSGAAGPEGAPGAKPQPGQMDINRGGRGSNDAGREVREAFQAQVQAAEDAAKRTETILDGELQRHEITMSQWLAQSKEALLQEQTAIKTAADQALASAALTSAQKVKIIADETHKLADLDTQWVRDQQKSAEEVAKNWQSAFNELNSAFEGQVSGLLKGTTTWAQAVKNVLASLTEDLIKFFLKWGLEQAETVAKNILLGNAQVAAHLTGNAAMAASDATTSSAGALSSLGSSLKAIQADAAATFGGVFAFLSPIMGPAASGPATASAAAVTAAGGVIGAMDIGAWNLPQDQLAFVHKNELIMPSAEAGAFRSMLSGAASGQGGAGGGGGDVHFHIAGSIVGQQAFLKQLMPQMARELRLYQALNPSTT